MVEPMGRNLDVSLGSNKFLAMLNITLGTIQVLRHQRGGWVGSENGNF